MQGVERVEAGPFGLASPLHRLLQGVPGVDAGTGELNLVPLDPGEKPAEGDPVGGNALEGRGRTVAQDCDDVIVLPTDVELYRNTVADSDEGAQAFRFDGALGSDMMSPRWWSLAGW